MKQKIYQQFVYKIESSRIIKAKNMDLQITPQAARMNNEVISLADSTALRMIDSLNGVDRDSIAEQIAQTRNEIKELRLSTRNSVNPRKRIKELYNTLDELQFKNDYVMVVMNRKSDFEKLNLGFKINGVTYTRLVGTPNGVKKSTVVYCPIVNKNGIHIHEELERRFNCGRDESKKLVPAKFEAYKSLVCSASIPVSMPKDVLVVDDFIIRFTDSIIRLESKDDSDEPVMTEENDEVELNASDGFGLMCPALAERWSKEVNLNYTTSGMCLRNVFCKGMVYTFDFHEFAKRYYDKDTIDDVWGNSHNINDVELILPVSVMKLWDSYSSLSDYLTKSNQNGHSFAVTKTCEEKLEEERTLNYQFIQSYDLTDDEIKALVKPTIDEIKETISGDADKTLLFMRGACGKNYDFFHDTNNLTKALMVEPQVAKDPFVISTVNSMIKKRIDDLKIGVLKVHGNYTVISGDPFAFCQNIFGCNVPDNKKGLLKAGEIYSKYWVDYGKGKEKSVVCLRAPMSCANNIKSMKIYNDEDTSFWYRYMNTVNIINCHDTFYAAENGADNDGDAIFTTDNEILLRKTRQLPAIMCVQKKADKSIITKENLEKANENSFGDEIGAITNRITTMYDIITKFKRGSPEYEILEYRIKCGQLQQQDCIDRAKGIISKPMPSMWYDIHSVVVRDGDDAKTIEKKQYNRKIIADKKPYFMIYIYPQLRKEYRKYISDAKKSCQSQFGICLEELLCKLDRTEQQEEFVKWYWKKYPVSDENGVMNRLCHYVEQEFEGYLKSAKNTDFDYKNLLVSKDFGTGYIGKAKEERIKDLLGLYRSLWQSMAIELKGQGGNAEETNEKKHFLNEWFKRELDGICVNAQMQCDILLKLCYKTEQSKRFVWNMCDEQIVKNLLTKNEKYSFFTADDNGTVAYRGKKYRKITVNVSSGEE